jgi:hypothetical protein
MLNPAGIKLSILRAAYYARNTARWSVWKQMRDFHQRGRSPSTSTGAAKASSGLSAARWNLPRSKRGP